VSFREHGELDTTGGVALRECWQCPTCGAEGFREDPDGIVCTACTARYFKVMGIPVLIRSDHPLFPPLMYLQDKRIAAARREALRKLIPSPSVNLVRRSLLSQFKNLLPDTSPVRVLLVGCGNQKEEMASSFGSRVTLIATDVSPEANVDAWCDAHALPFRNGSIEGVIATAVLEHVLAPETAVAEIQRVLRPDGVVYSEIPFMQQVHEGAYDFTRYSHLGHRKLFCNFRELKSGVVAGPGTALVWALENFAACLPRSDRGAMASKLVARCASFWLKYADHILAHRPRALDAASCTYFLGKKESGYRLADADLIRGYRHGTP
jgi:SAM-dependent methyltransferase